jgi:hypothetical protein
MTEQEGTMINQDRAAEIFLRRLTQLAYRGVIQTRGTLEEQSASLDATTPYLQWVESLRQWYQSLTDEDRQKVQEIIWLYVRTFLFRLCCYLDRVTGGPSLEELAEELQGYYSDFVVYLQVYKEFEDYLRNQPIVGVWVKPENTPDLHDQLDEWLEAFHSEWGWESRSETPNE